MSMQQSIKDWYIRYTEFKWIVGVAEYDPDTIRRALTTIAEVLERKGLSWQH